MLTSITTAVALLAANTAAKIWYAGVSESSGEFGVYSGTATPGTGLPGTFGVDYAFINKSAIDIYVDQNKINLFRVAFLLERMCPIEYGLGSKFNETHFAFYKDAIDYITVTKGAYAIFDPHNYMRYNNPSQQPMTGSVIGNASDPSAATTEQFGEFWEELAGRFKDNPKVIFGIMNEPHDMPTSLVLQDDQAAIDGIRRSGARQLILAPGNGYTGGHAWLQSSQGDEPSGDYLNKLHDPIENTAMDIHEYLDADFSGGHVVCSQNASYNLDPLTSWLRKHHLKARENNSAALVSEFGGSNTTVCDHYVSDLIDYMEDREEYIGWAAWAAGPFWGTYSPCCNDGHQWGSLEPNSVAADGSPGLYTTVWLKVIEPLLPKHLQKSGISSIHGGPTF